MSAVENYEDKKDYETEGPSSGAKFETDAAAYVQAVDEKGVLSARAGVHEARLKRGYVLPVLIASGTKCLTRPLLPFSLKARHIAMISIGGVIGTGLFLGTGGALSNGGPLGLLLGCE